MQVGAFSEQSINPSRYYQANMEVYAGNMALDTLR
jgi:hypothetical protein